ncbi:DUF4012 domain-containing protein [Micromonospora olivasterospora]|uniref:Uncharacterized protein DUF4012 n=1 Tax=Micromonospora olivasterospora TaxID=1880 RepID=A0A562IGB0_MICOL|nr:DUF4012 domain-containing protein [Micromonospora olivasterospora]TWH69858.1 uncharacterized protein DUF4012 [Micromonospora olivasterospora]
MSDSERRRRGGRRSRRTRARVRRVLLVGLLVGTLVLLTGGWVGFRGWQARAHLLNAAGLARELSGDVVGADAARAQRTLSALQEQAGAARAATGDPGWWLGRHVPYAGDDLSAVRQIAVAIDDLARGAFPALLRTDLSTLLPGRGQLDVNRLRAVASELSETDAVVQRTRARLAAVPTGNLVAQVRRAVTDLRAEIDRLAGLTRAADRAARLLPTLLGADGPRSYLMVSQNPAELRATGGMFGAYALIKAENGRLRMAGQGTSASLGRFTPPLKLSRDVRALYADLPGIYPADVNLTPDFPTAAALYREMYRKRSGTTVDGVLAVDPVVLSYLLQATGPVPVPGRPALVAEKVVQTLLSDTYQRLKPAEQDEYFAASSAAVFTAFFSRDVNPRAFLSGIDRAITERRILFWSARPEEQRIIGENRLAGSLPEQETVPTVGVFLNDGSGAKLGYYLRPAATLTVGECRPDGRRQLRLRFTLHSTAPASGLSASVLGLGLAGDPYTARTLVSVHSPAGGAVLGSRLDGHDARAGSGYERRRQVAVATVEVRPGATRTLEVDLLTGATGSGDGELWLTPTATPWTTQVVSAPHCDQ